MAKSTPLRFVTLTIRTGSRNCKEALNHLYKSFRKLRASDIWRENVTGGVAVAEAKIGDRSGEWHIHYHCLVAGSYLPQRALSKAWYDATGDSFIVDVRAVRDAEKGTGYVCKYLGKGFDQSVLQNPERLCECISAFAGRRLLTAFGDWFGRVGDLDIDAGGEWRVVGSLDGIIAAAGRGDEWASGILLCLSGRFQRSGLAEAAPPPWWARGPSIAGDDGSPEGN